MGVDPNIVLGNQSYKNDKKDEKNIQALKFRRMNSIGARNGDKPITEGSTLKINGRSYKASKGKNPWGFEYKRTFSKDEKQDAHIKQMRGDIGNLQTNQKKPAEAQKPKPKGDQQIDPVQYSPEINHARNVVNQYQAGMKDNKSPWAQAQADATDSSTFGNFNPGGKTSSDQPQKDPQEFADKYKLNLIQSGATTQNNTDFTSGGESSLSSSDILKRDQELYGN